MKLNRSGFKIAFWPKLRVGPSFQVLDIPEYACGLALGLVLTWNQNQIFEKVFRIFLASLTALPVASKETAITIS